MQLKALGVEDVAAFPLVDPPPRQLMVRAGIVLMRLKALDRSGKLTELGRRMANLPVEPAFARLLIESASFNCTSEVLLTKTCRTFSW